MKMKKELNLIELIQYVWDNNIEGRGFKTESGLEVYFTEYGKVSVDPFVSKDDVFTVEVEEEITEDTHLSGLVAIFIDGYREEILFKSFPGKCIKECIDYFESYGHKPLSFHYVHDDGSLTPLWKDGVMV